MVDGQPLELVLVKNPAGFTVALGTYGSTPVSTMIAINDNYADGRDVSWLYDVSFDSLRDRGVAMTSGVRAYDMALRLQLRRRRRRRHRARPRPGPRRLPHRAPRRAQADLLHLHRDDEPAAGPRRALRPARLRGGGPVSNQPLQDIDVAIPGEPEGSAWVPGPEHAGKGVINLVHLYPREMSIYGDLGNTRCLAARIRRHGYSPWSTSTTPAGTCPASAHLLVGGGGQDSGQVRVEADLEPHRRPPPRARRRRHADADDLRHVPAVRQRLHHRRGPAPARASASSTSPRRATPSA